MNILRWIYMICPLVSIVCFYMVFHTPEYGTLRLHFVDIGQGDGIFIETVEGKRIVVDGGPDQHHMADYIQEQLGPIDTRIDLVILSHPDADHIVGLTEVIERFSVEHLLINDMNEHPSLQELVNTAEIHNVQVTVADPLQDMRIDGYTLLDIVAPSKKIIDAATNTNNASTVFRILSGDIVFLFVGDAEKEEEDIILREGYQLDAYLLKGGHHGSQTSSTSSFLSSITADIVVFQNGQNNTFGHPIPEVLTRIESMGSEVYNTSLSGSIVIECAFEIPCTVSEEYATNY